ncbi:MAG TPA: hypothetical protein VLE73_02810 [Candidatus Saccharimonadales bacterium]|nr:hypothetical protein [Candidatus Saccharimonadales bacterium]
MLRLGKIRSLKKFIKKIKPALPITIALVAIIGSIGYRHIMPFYINPTAYTPLLNTIAKGESNGNYNAYYGNAGNTSLLFTTMPVGEVLAWQDNFVRQGNSSNAVGKYQIIRPTLAGLVQQLRIDPSTPFSEQLQDKMAIALLERRGAQAFVQNKISREEFAANLAKEWAALPSVQGTSPNDSYYAGDGLNHAHISIDELFAALASLRQLAS